MITFFAVIVFTLIWGQNLGSAAFLSRYFISFSTITSCRLMGNP